MTTKALRVDGADVSHHQGALDLPKARKAGLKFLYSKATEGDSYVDPSYAARRKAAKEAGIPFGAYHFARAEVGDAVAEARRFVKVADPKPGDLAPALDLETAEGLTLGQLKRWAKTFSDEVERLIGVKPVIYSPWDFGLPNIRWVPRYNDDNRPPAVPWDVWQFSNGQLGVPDQHPGLGHVDLNTYAKGFMTGDLQIPPVKTPAPVRPVVHVDVSHFSMQFSDSPAQQNSDAEKIFARAQARKTRWITGTEAGGGSELASFLKAAAKRHGYRIFIAKGSDAWIAVRADVIKKGSWKTFYRKIIDGVAKRYTDKGVVAVTFDDVELGTVTVIAAHYLTKGRPDAKDPAYRQFLEQNKAIARAIGEHAALMGRGVGIVFYGGDQNIVDRDADTFLGAPLTSVWDELDEYQNTGHGNIDVIASYDKDGRVTAVYIRALPDSVFKLFTDHFGVDAGFDVKKPKAA